MSDTLLLVRHTEVARAWAGRCYGQSDMGLSRAGARAAADLAARLAAQPIALVVHSDLRRAAALATRVARRAGVPVHADPHWRERDFGRWEGRRWTALYRETGVLMDRMLTDPHGFAPGGGETSAALAARAEAALRALQGRGTVLVVSHGGPIAAARAAHAGAPLTELARFIPALGEIVRLAL
ncbi:histidine phosphatase family protein [Sphingomonas morindae]|uniref:Histidine phosphatase family protein n=1 Tax=Sphingomonas morindae TaxID=1541170 RepID=A0ABY4XBI9_9SPHN|nr:histidine phosphatase family protein [Sphingomonas morindae]USI74322.1 histidine phosphatase family protein [Sphingomonas morindae]